MLQADAQDARANISLENAWPARGPQRLVAVRQNRTTPETTSETTAKG
jgi:hypothetical protein